jgi:hypothetical protein
MQAFPYDWTSGRRVDADQGILDSKAVGKIVD